MRIGYLRFSRICCTIPVLVASIFLFAGCGDDAAGPILGGSFDPFSLWSSTGDATYGQLYVTSQWYQRSDYPGYRSGGEIYTTTDHDSLITAGTMICSNQQMLEVGPGAYNDLRGGTGNGPTFGAVTAWSIAGNPASGIPAFTNSMYVPAEIRIAVPTVSTVAISKSQPLTIEWNADANNEAVLIIVDYMVDESLMRDSNLTTTDYRWKTITDDDGSFTVVPSDLAGLPVGGLFQIVLARGASKKGGTTSHPFHIYAYSTAAGMYAVSQ